MINTLHLICISILTFALTGCSVYKAASDEGIALSDISRCKTEGCFLSHGMDIINKHEVSKDQYIVTYRAIARKSGANYLRAAGHGALDVMSLGLWEIAGTPIEGALSNNRGYITAKATYTHGKDSIDHIQIYDASGKVVIDKKIGL